VFYLLGYLRNSQDRKKEAAAYFCKAVEKDPDYVNAWANLVATAEKAGLSREEKDRALVRVIELTGKGSVSDVSDLKLLWKTLLETERKTEWRKPKSPLYPLAAADAMKKEEMKRENRYDGFDESDRSYGSVSRSEITSHPVIGAFSNLLSSEE